MHRAARPAGSLVIVLVAYWAYALVAVPLIEPPADPALGGQISEKERLEAQGRIDAAMADLQELFKPGDWELGNPKILESDNVKLLMQEYRNLGNGRVEIHPCTLILTPEATDPDQPQHDSRAVILQAPEGARLEFDGPLDLRQMNIGRLVGGRLIGPITIRSQGELPGTDDDLLITTREVQLTQRNIITPNTVSFRYGPHYGQGAQMKIKLLAEDQRPEGSSRQGGLAGIESFELGRLERLHLELPQPGLTSAENPLSPPTRPDTSALHAPPAGPTPGLPVEITCQGPFRFDAIRGVATFHDRVSVVRVNPDGPSDQLGCQQLSVFFTDHDEPTAASPDRLADAPEARPADGLNLQPKRIEARGEPVVLVAPGKNLQAQGRHLAYDLTTDRITANGPGWLRGQTDQRPDRQLEAHWNEQLLAYPDQDDQIISLAGGAQLISPDIGRLEAGEIHFQLSRPEPQNPDDKPSLRPERMLARNQVRIDSPELSASVEQLELHFKPSPIAAAKPTLPGGRPTENQPTNLLPLSGRPHGAQATADADPLEPPPQQHVHVSGRVLQATMLLHDNDPPELCELVVQDAVQFLETQTEQPGQQPLLVSGDWLRVIDADKPHAAVTVAGRPAHFQGRGFGLGGQNINLNRGTNRLWIDGAGQMDILTDRDLDGQLLDQPVVLQVNWQDSMDFDGRVATFQGSVTVAAPHRYLQTETLKVQFTRPIDFSAERIAEDPRIQQISCLGGVLMESLSFEQQIEASLQQTQTSHERVYVLDLQINLDSGELTAAGPGWLSSVRRSSEEQFSAQSGGLAAALSEDTSPPSPDSPAGDEDDQLRSVHVRFQGPVRGSISPGRREMVFTNHVQAAYAPAESWADVPDVNNPDALGPRGILMTCDRLTLSEMPTAQLDNPTWEFLAEGNTVVDGNTFTARGARISYAQAKDLLILEGDARTDAQLFLQPRLGGPASTNAARKIYYWPSTERLKIEGARLFQFDRAAAP